MAELGAGEIQVRVHAAEDETPHISLTGELDCSNAEQVRRALDEVLANEPKSIVFELAGLSFMDSSGIALLVHAANHCRVELDQPTQIVRRVVEVTGLIDTFTITR